MIWNIRNQHNRLSRQFSTVISKSVSDFVSAVNSHGTRVFVSGFNQPYLNIAMEDYIFQHMPVTEDTTNDDNSAIHNRLLLYVNNPCVVIGRNQNPWRECNVPLIKSLQIPLVRRRSGGGTVVHDSQNVNFSVMTRRVDFTRQRHAQMIADAVNALPAQIHKRTVPPKGSSGETSDETVDGPQVKLKLNERYDIVDADEGRKVSGSAYKIQRQKAYHHGTMLLNSNLNVLKSLLSRDPQRMGVVEGRGVESVKSPVANIGMDKDVFITTVIKAFMEEYSSDAPVMLIQPNHLPKEVHQAARDLAEWEWAFGQTPDFTHTVQVQAEGGPESEELTLEFHVSKGNLKSIRLLNDDKNLQDVEPGLALLQTLIQKPDHHIQYTASQVGEFITNHFIRKSIQGALDGSGSNL